MGEKVSGRTPADSTWLDADAALELAGRRVHFVGIGGCGMSGLARIVRSVGAVCSGSDHAASPTTEALARDGIEVVLEQRAGSLPADCELVVASAAIRPEHPEVAEAARRGVATLKYAQALGRLMIGRTGVAIAGTHGKSTTTAMLAHAAIHSGLDPTFIVGATCRQIGGGSRTGRSDVLIAEACEFDRSFHNFRPTISAVLNVEEDHLDVYGTLDAVVEAFHRFARLTHPDGLLLVGHEGAHRTAVAAGVDCRVETVGFAPEADWCIRTRRDHRGHQHVSVRQAGVAVCEFALGMPGEHMASNAAFAAVLTRRLGAAWDKVAEAMAGFAGLDRRMQHLGERNGVTVVDDYGHHPTEIAKTLRALRAHYDPAARDGRVICVFQPHQHSRTRFLMDQFATSFGEADVVIVPHIYFVRDSESDRRAVSAGDLVARLTERGVHALHIDAFEAIVSWLEANARPGDLLVVMGAGPVWEVGHRFLAAGPPRPGGSSGRFGATI